MAAHNKTISTKAHPGLCKPKKMIDHKAFKTNCIPNIANANRHVIPAFEPESRRLHTNQTATPIIAYSVTHTGPNNQEGGFHAGLTIPVYQVSIAPTVKNDPMIPASSAIAIAIINCMR